VIVEQRPTARALVLFGLSSYNTRKQTIDGESPDPMSSPTDSFLSTKRPRIHKSKSGNDIETYECPDLWFEDGNIILRTIVGDRNAFTACKVHKSILASHSNVFHDLFDGPQAAFDVGSDRYDGVSVMDLPDSPSEVNNFLKALYFPE
jgi:hypothetical protein